LTPLWMLGSKVIQSGVKPPHSKEAEAEPPVSDAADRPLPLRQLGDDDLEFVQRLVLASGSLKELAGAYGVSYPTIRARLDKLIDRLRALVEGRPPDPMADRLADLIARGEVAPSAAQAVLNLHRKLLKAKGG